MNPPENFYVLDQILKTEPRSLKWIFVEVDNIETKSHVKILGTQRLLYWHDWPRTALTLRKAINPRPDTKWYQRLNRLWTRAARADPAPRAFREAIYQCRARGGFLLLPD